MTVPELIERLQGLPGDCDLRNVYIEAAKKKPKNFPYEEPMRFEIESLGLDDNHVTVKVRRLS